MDGGSAARTRGCWKRGLARRDGRIELFIDTTVEGNRDAVIRGGKLRNWLFGGPEAVPYLSIEH
jgi:hypothetical protein